MNSCLEFVDLNSAARLKCDEAPEEEATITFEKVSKIECNIGMTTNFMASGIKDVRQSTATCKPKLIHPYIGARPKGREKLALSWP